MRKTIPRKSKHTPHLQTCTQVVATEANALALLAQQMPIGTSELLELFASVRGSLIFTGIGKSGHVAQLLAATFCSVGIPALFLHAAEALHGDVGMVRPGDVCCMISKSGHGHELALLAKVLAGRNIPTALLACQKGSLYQLVDIGVVLPLNQEACGHDVVPTSSLLVTLSFGHAIALQLAHERGFTPDVFGQQHPAGSLGKNLLLTVDSCMTQGDALPLVEPDMLLAEVIGVVTAGHKGVAIVCDDERRLCGVVTDGDIRRACAQGQAAFALTAQQMMTRNPKTIMPSAKAREALQFMYRHQITSLVVVNDRHQVAGLVHMHDVVAAGITLPKEKAS